MRTKKGTVVSIKMDKTIVVSVNSYKNDPIYKKRYKVTKKFYAHDEKNSSKLWDEVTIKEVKPISKTKKWVLVDEKKV